MWPRRRKPCPPTETVQVRYVCCLDAAGRRSVLTVGLTGDGQVTLTSPRGDLAILDPLQAAPLRASLRDLVTSA